MCVAHFVGLFIDDDEADPSLSSHSLRNSCSSLQEPSVTSPACLDEWHMDTEVKLSDEEEKAADHRNNLFIVFFLFLNAFEMHT